MNFHLKKESNDFTLILSWYKFIKQNINPTGQCQILQGETCIDPTPISGMAHQENVKPTRLKIVV